MVRRGVLFVAALWFAWVQPGSLAAQAAVHWYQPHYLSSVDEASNRLQFMSPHFAPMGGGFTLTSGGTLTRMDINQLGLNFTFSKSGLDDIVTTIVYADIGGFEIWNFPKARGYPAPWCAVPLKTTLASNNILCVPAEQDVHDLIDVLATLVVASGTIPQISFGMSLNPVPDKELKKHPEETGMLVAEVDVDGPAAQAGIKENDILHAVNGQPCTRREVIGAAITAAVAGKPQGGVVHVEILRKERPMEFDLHYPHVEVDTDKLRQSAQQLAQQNAPSAAGQTAAPPSGLKFGFQVRAVTEADVIPMALLKPQGVVVMSVQKGGLADTLGFQPGDVILKGNDTEFTDILSFTQYIHSEAVSTFTVWRKGQTVVLSLPQSF